MRSLADVERRQVRALERGDDEEWERLASERVAHLVEGLEAERESGRVDGVERDDYSAEPDF